MKNQKIADIVEKLQNSSQNMPKAWDGKKAILEMKEAGSTQWRQMERMGFYFEFLCETRFDGIIDMPGKNTVIRHLTHFVKFRGISRHMQPTPKQQNTRS